MKKGIVHKVVRPYQRQEDEGTRPDYVKHSNSLAEKEVTSKARKDFDEKIKQLREREGTA